MTTIELENKLYYFITPAYPNISITVTEATDKIRQLYFTEEKFKYLYPQQRYHYLVHLIPDEFFNQHLADTEWFELAPDESKDELNYHDQETIDDIKNSILSILKDKVHFVSMLDEMFMQQSAKCYGDFRHSKEILRQLNFSEEDQFDIFHALMNEGGYCDCEILLNVFHESQYSQQYWQNRH